MIAVLRILLYVSFFAFGAYMVKLKLLEKQLAEKFLKFLFYIGLPISIFYAISVLDIRSSDIYLTVSSILISALSAITSYLAGRSMRLPKKSLAVLVGSVMIMNTSLTLPFVEVLYGAKGLALLSLFDLGNLLMIFSLVYFLMIKIGGIKKSFRTIEKKILLMPPMWVMIFSLILNFNGFRLQGIYKDVFYITTMAIFLVVMFTLGMLFDFSWAALKRAWPGLLLRYAGGGIIGIFVVWLLQLDGLSRIVVLAGALAPNGYTSLVYAKMAKLDANYAAQIVSISLGLGIVATPIILILLDYL